jgi:hypothetical protein
MSKCTWYKSDNGQRLDVIKPPEHKEPLTSKIKYFCVQVKCKLPTMYFSPSMLRNKTLRI